MQRILVSACLLGHPVRHDGGQKSTGSPVLRRWLAEGRVVAVCPEVAGGLPVPRLPAEIRAGAGGAAVLAGRAPVVDVRGADVSPAFVAGARQALQLAQAEGIRIAILQDGSPSCGPAHIHDGTFSGIRIRQQGVTAALLTQAGLRVFSQTQIDEAQACLASLEAAQRPAARAPVDAGSAPAGVVPPQARGR